MVIAACTQEGGFVANLLLHFESQCVAPERQRAIEVSDLQMDVVDIGPDRSCSRRSSSHRRLHHGFGVTRIGT